MIRVEGINKIFGSDPASILPLLEQGKSKSEIQAETRHVVGVRDATFNIEPNQIFAIMGLSGSGKSTMIRCVNRLIEPTAGRIILDDPEMGERDVTAMSSEELRQMRRRDMSMVFQHFALFPHRSVLSNVVYGLEVQGRDRAEREAIGRHTLDMVGLGEWAAAYPAELSGGMQQRVGLARALATEARILLMDEPFSALDPLIRVQMQQELKKLQSELGRTILFITHDLDEAMHIGDRIAIMESGEIVQIGTPEEILVNPRTEYVARFVEQADPTGVITAATVALPLDARPFRQVREAGEVNYFSRHGYDEVEYGIDADGRLREALVEGRPATVKSLPQALELEVDAGGARRSGDFMLVCREDQVLRDLLRGRVLSALPIIVADEEDRVRGIVDETELISGILEKRGERDATSGASR